MAHLIQIGNSQGVRIPKPLIEEAHFVGAELTIKVVSEGILISPQRNPREGWRESISKALESSNVERVDTEWLDASMTDDEGLEW